MFAKCLQEKHVENHQQGDSFSNMFEAASTKLSLMLKYTSHLLLNET